MTIRNLAVTRIAFVALTVAAIVLVSLTSSVAQISVKDGTEFLDKAKHSYARANYMWPYATGPMYPGVDTYQQGVVWTPAGVFQLQGALAIPDELRASANKLESLGAQYYVIAYHTELGVLESLRSMIENRGGAYMGSPTDGSVIAKLNPSALEALQTATGILAIEPYHGAFKLEPSIGRTPLRNPIKALSNTYSLEVVLWPGEDSAAVAEAILAIGGTVSRSAPDSLVVELHRSLLPQLADIEAVRMVHENLTLRQLGEETTSVMQHWNPREGWSAATPYHDAGVTGAGLGLCNGDLSTSCTFRDQAIDCNGIGDATCRAQQVLMVLDSGFQLDAGDLSQSRVLAGAPGPGHRKMRAHETTNQFGAAPGGDLSGCDAAAQGGFTHGHMVATTAMGNATNVDPVDYGNPWIATDQQGAAWALDGVAPGAVVVGYDGQITPPNGSCSAPGNDGISAGDLYSGGASGSLGESYVAHGARTMNFSWGSPNNVYSGNAIDIDQFLADKRDAMVFISAGNFGADIIPEGGDGIPDEDTLGSPSTARNALCIGASRNANTVNSPSSRALFSSVGPAVNGTVNRIAPQLMAPGDEPGGGSLGISSEFVCRSFDNDQNIPVQCDIIAGVEGTSFSAPAAAGAALLVRDYFSQGFHPDRVQKPSDSLEIGGALVKAVLASSAEFMGGASLSRAHRWNNEQGYGRIQLDNVLPLESWSDSPSGLLIVDPFSGETNIDGISTSIGQGQVQNGTFELCNDDEELHVMLAWIDNPTGLAPLRNDLDLTLISPTGIEYRGNYFTDDDNQNGIPEDICIGPADPCEDCGGIGSGPNLETANLLIDESQWSLPVCSKTSVLGKNLFPRTFDNSNPTEGIFLSHDPENDNEPLGGNPGTGGFEGTCTPDSSDNANGACDNNLNCRTPGNPGAAGDCVNQDDYKQPELGTWQIIIKTTGTIAGGSQEFAVAIAGGVCLGSVTKFDEGSYTCNERTTVTVTEIEDGPLDLNPSEGDISNRTTVQVCELDEVLECSFDSDNVGDACSDNSTCTGSDNAACEDCTVVDSESGLNFSKDPNGLKFESDPLQLTDGTGRDPGNGALDIRDGDVIRVLYQDIDPDTGDPGTRRANTGTIDCKVEIGFGPVVFSLFGQNSSVAVLGGCERNVRGQFEFGFPDRYMDAGESIVFDYAFRSDEADGLESVKATLSCVNADVNSPDQCLPSGAGCLEELGTLDEPDCGGPGGCSVIGGPCYTDEECAGPETCSAPAPPSAAGPQTCDPLRLDNTPCEWMTILQPSMNMGFLPGGNSITANFAIEMEGDGPGEAFEDVGNGQPTPTVEMLLQVVASVSGKTGSALAVSRQQLNRDTLTEWYSTDFPTGGTEVLDGGPGVIGNNDEVAGPCADESCPNDPLTSLAGIQANDYRFETFIFSDLTANGKNQNLMSPWNFDGNNGGFTHGLNATSDSDATQAGAFNISNWGEDKNFNNIEDGVCAEDASIACYNFGGDLRCPFGSPLNPNLCRSAENNDTNFAFHANWNTKGGCGWQTRAPSECADDPVRGCFTDEDCLGTCHVPDNDIASGFEACADNGDCPTAPRCSSIGNPNPLNPCPNGDVDCGGVASACQNVTQQCDGEAGLCGAIQGDHTGGVWHTGNIGDVGDVCDGGELGACANYKVVAGTDGELVWWELLATPVMEKVNTNFNDDGTDEATIEIFDWAWNQQVDMSDNNVAYSWEMDTDLSKLEPADLFADGTVLGLGFGAYGAISLSSNPALTRGWGIFAAQGACNVAPFGPCDQGNQCAGSTCSISTDACLVDADCAAGSCAISANSCFSGLDCAQGACSGSGDPCIDNTFCDELLLETCIGAEACTGVEGCGVSTCTVGGGACATNFQCDVADNTDVCSGGPKCVFTGLASVNGSGTNPSRVGDAGCFFEGNIAPLGFGDLGLARPLDDDINNDPGNDALIDEYVQDDGPYRNTDIVQFNGPDMRLGTLEDIYGDTGDTFQGAIGFRNVEGTTGSVSQQGYGLAVDDMVVKWREFTLEEDITDCADAFTCAVIQLATGNIFEGQAVLTVTVLDSVPSDNDCDLDGTSDFVTDCNNNGIPDVVIRANSEVEQGEDGEVYILDETSTPGEYVGEFPISVLSNSDGVLYLAPEGTDNPTVTVTYVDLDIDPGPGVELCPNDVDPAKHGILRDLTSVFLFTEGASVCQVVVADVNTFDNGDGDFFPDTHETINMSVSLINNCGIDLTNCTGRLFSNSANVDCILDATIDVGDLDGETGEAVLINDQFVWKVSDVNRASVADEVNASFNLTMSCDQFDALGAQQEFSVILDLDLDDLGQVVSAWTEGFEGTALGKFFAENLDAGIPGANNDEGNINAQGYRCQYNDPDWVNGSAFGDADSTQTCYPGQNLAQADAIWWQKDGIDTGSPDGGRSFEGNYSAYFGDYLDEAMLFSTPINTIESMAVSNPINLGTEFPELTFWQQVSLVDNRSLNMSVGFSAEKGAVQIKLVDNLDQDISDWMNLTAFQNEYDTQAFDNYFTCYFDPIDDGTTEDDFFDPADPNRRLGPSSTCFPEFTWSCQGDTDAVFAVDNVCNAGTLPAPDSHTNILPGSVGTWIESKVNLSAFRGQRARLRFIVTGFHATEEDNYEGAFGFNPDPRDDGWWIDEVAVDESLPNPAELNPDPKNLSHCAGDPSVGCYTAQDCIDNGTVGPCQGTAPQCGPTCVPGTVPGLGTPLSAQVTTIPDETGGALDEVLVAPGQPLTLDASASFGTCLDGALQYRFSKDGGTTVLRGFSENPIFVSAPVGNTDFLVEIRCSSDGPAYDCSAAGTSPDAAVAVDLVVDCPGFGSQFATIVAENKTTWTWALPRQDVANSVTFELLQGDLGAVSTYTGTVSGGVGNSFTAAAVPASGDADYFIVRKVVGPAFCNNGSWATDEDLNPKTDECTLSSTAAPWWPAPFSGGVPPVCDRDADIP